LALNDVQNLAFDGIYMWIVNYYQYLEVYDTTGTLITGPIDTNVPPYNFAGDVESMCFDGQRMWIGGNGSILASIDVNTYSLINRIDGSNPYYNLADPYGITFDGKKIWISNYSNNSITSVFVGKY